MNLFTTDLKVSLKHYKPKRQTGMNIKNKRMAFLGDSITEGRGVADIKDVFWKSFETNDNCTVFGYGISGTRIAKQNPEEAGDRYYLSRVPQMEEDVDVVVVFGGTNDYGHGTAPFGKMSDRTDDTFYGAVHNLMLALINKYPKATIVFMTPLHRINEHNVYNERGLRNVGCLEDYANIIKEVAAYYAIPVLDLYKISGIQPEVPILKEIYMPDGLHPNSAGHELIYNRLKGFLETL
jgi:lysophospholipase L1-like esterase